MHSRNKSAINKQPCFKHDVLWELGIRLGKLADSRSVPRVHRDFERSSGCKTWNETEDCRQPERAMASCELLEVSAVMVTVKSLR